MAKKDGSENVESLTLELLRALRNDIRGLEQKMDSRFEQVDRRFEQVDRRFEQVDRRFEQVDQRFEQVDARFDRIARDFEALRLEMNVGFRALFELDGRRFLDHEGRLRRIETHLNLP